MQLKPRLLFDMAIAIISSTLAIYFVFQWFNHGFPLYGYDDMLGGTRKTLLPFLWPAIILLCVSLLASFDFYAHKD